MVRLLLPDEAAAEDHHLRIIDESGEDYVYPADYFILIVVSQAVEKALLPLSPQPVVASDAP